MSRGNFPPHLFDSIFNGEASFTVSDAPIEGPVMVMTSRVSECSPEMLAQEHVEEPCVSCKQPCIIHPETLRIAKVRSVLCWPCGAAMGYKPQEVVMHPQSLAETLFPKGRQ